MNKQSVLIFILAACFCCLSKFCFGDDWQRVYLATFPRSGNHWIRYLVEEASNIATSSDMQDSDPIPYPANTIHLPNLFPWGGYCAYNGYEGNRRYPNIKEIVLIKTHAPIGRDYNSLTSFPKAIKSIRIVRHPVDCFYSWYVYACTASNIKTDQFIPTEVVKTWIKEWKEFQNYWNKQPNVITYRYEDLLNPDSLESALTEIIHILKYPVTSEDIERACNRYPPTGRPLKHLDKFRKEDFELINRELGDIMKQYGYSIPLN